MAPDPPEPAKDPVGPEGKTSGDHQVPKTGDQDNDGNSRRARIKSVTMQMLGSAAALSTPEIRIVRRARRQRDKFPLSSTDDIKRADRRLDLSLKRLVAGFALVAVSAQLVVADVVFVFYAWKGQKWDVPTSGMQAWLAAAVVQVLGILYVIARYLFPRRDADAPPPSVDN